MTTFFTGDEKCVASREKFKDAVDEFNSTLSRLSDEVGFQTFAEVQTAAKMAESAIQLEITLTTKC